MDNNGVQNTPFKSQLSFKTDYSKSIIHTFLVISPLSPNDVPTFAIECNALRSGRSE